MTGDTEGSTWRDNASSHCCFRCYSGLLLGPMDDNTTATTKFKSTEEMKRTLHDASIDVPSNMPPGEIEDLYDAMINTDGGCICDE
jgi:hypothetical protein